MSSIQINGDELHYDDLGSGDRTIVWGHGFLFSTGLYHDLIALVPGYRHIAVDFRGHGRSASVTGSGTVGRMAEDVHALTRELGVDRFVYIGHSMGNAVGLRLAAKHPEAVRAAVSIAGVPAAGMPESTRPLTSAIVTLLGNEEQFTAALGELFVHEGMESVIKASGASAALVQAAPLAGIAETELYLDESEQILPALTQPWLFLIPGDDAAIPADAQLAGARGVPGARIVWFNGEGHIFPQERPAEVAAVLRTFLDGLPA